MTVKTRKVISMGKVKNERVILFRTKNINKNTVRYEIEVESSGIFL